jgi:TolA-binding protein
VTLSQILRDHEERLRALEERIERLEDQLARVEKLLRIEKQERNRRFGAAR